MLPMLIIGTGNSTYLVLLKDSFTAVETISDSDLIVILLISSFCFRTEKNASQWSKDRFQELLHRFEIENEIGILMLKFLIQL